MKPPPIEESSDSILLIEPTLGLDVAHPAVNEKPGATPHSENFIIRDGGLEPRPMLVPKPQTNAQPVTFVTGGMEGVDVTGIRTPILSGLTQPFKFSGGAWSRLSYVPAFGVNAGPSSSPGQYWDMTQVYDANSNQNLVVMATPTHQQLYVHQLGSTTFSTLTGAPQALYTTVFNSYLMAFNVYDPAGGLDVQRVQWNDRGSASSWTGGLSGFADLLDMHGQGTRIIPQENRVLLFSEDEVWQGVSVAYPFIFDFEPLDRGVGCPYPWTVANTPVGTMFLSKDWNVYLVSKFGGPARTMAPQVQKYIRDQIDHPERAWAVYDHTYNQYQLYFATKSGSGYPQQALYFDVPDFQYSPIFTQIGQGSWALQMFDKTAGQLSLTRGFEAQQSSGGTTWQMLKNAGVQWGDLTQTWGQLAGTSEGRAVIVGSSSGTAFTLDSSATADVGLSTQCVWQSSALFGYAPNKQKTMDRIRLDYAGDSSSSISLAASRNQGATFDPDFAVNLPANSAMSEAVAHFYSAARYPMFRVTSDGFRYRLFRFWLRCRVGGR